jgi:hypothetical protein
MGTYDAKVVLGYLLSIYTDETRKNLEAVGSIRNRFAHRPQIASFDHKELEPFFKKITLPNRLHDNQSTHHYHPIGMMAPISSSASKRLRFLTTSQMLLAYIFPHVYHGITSIDYGPPF